MTQHIRLQCFYESNEAADRAEVNLLQTRGDRH